jgi:hypothetical protein
MLVLRKASRYAVVDKEGRQIVLDLRALFLAMLSVGLSDKATSNFGGESTWFAEWLSMRVGDNIRLRSVADEGMTGTPTLLGALQQDFEVIPSVSVRNALEVAVGYADRTLKGSTADLRHLFAAMLTSSSAPDALARLGWAPTEGDLTDLRQALYARIAENKQGEDMEAWREILEGEPQYASSSRRDFLPSFTDDRPAEYDPKRETRKPGESPKDQLDTESDITALARLICLNRVTPPLSIGIFGGWGAGKSTFMNRLETEIAEIVKGSAGLVRQRGKTGTSKPTFITNVVQIRFNAWQFSDANLWASLTAEFFDQLRAGGFAQRSIAAHSKLATQVHDHVHQLAKAAVATREAVDEGNKRLVAAQKERDIAVEEIERTEPKAFSHTLIETIATAYETHKPDLVELGRRAYQDDPTKGIDDFVSAAKDVHSIGGRLKLIVASLTATSWRTAISILAILLATVCIWTLPSLDSTSVVTLFTSAGVWSALATLGAAVGALRPGIRAVAAILHSTASFAETLQSSAMQGLQTVLEKEAVLKAAEAEATARHDAAARANGALTRYGSSNDISNPSRLLRYVLEDNPDTKAIDQEIGLIGRSRRLFQAVDTIVSEKRRVDDEAHQDVPDRIVLYIDDLDRCTHRQVYDVLQAIHLLLAFEAFVVVVAVDVAWIQAALAAQTEMGMPPEPTVPGDGADAERRKTAIDVERRKRAITYLEKIFQVPFWLRPLNIDGRDGGSYRALVQGLLEPSKIAPQSEKPTEGSSQPSGGMMTSVETVASQKERETTTKLAPVSAREKRTEALNDALTAVKLTQEEIDFLASPAIGAIGPRTPRGAKRLVNVYLLVCARMNDLGSSSIPATDDQLSRPIVALLAAVETGQPVEVADPLYEGLKASAPETDFIKDVIHPEVQPSDPGRLALQSAFRACPALEEAVIKVMEAGGDRPSLTVGDCLPLARLVRRYSFNRYQ